MAVKEKNRVRKDTGEEMGKKGAQGGAQAQERPLVQVNRSRTYNIVEPPKEKMLDPKFDIPDSSLGRAARDFILICRAEEEISEDRLDAHQKLIEELKRARKTDFKVQLGRTLYELTVNHMPASEKIKLKAV